MQASFPTLPAGHPGLPACQDCFRVVKGKNPQSVCSMTQNDHQSAIRQNPAPSVSLVCFHLWLLTFPWLPFDSWQGRIINPLHPSCVGGVNESMARSTSRWESFFSVEKKQHFTQTVLCLHWILVYFLMLWALELASVLVFWQIPPSMITEDCGCRKKHLHFTAEDLKKQMFFNFSSFIKKTKTFRWISKDYSYICDHSCRFFFSLNEPQQPVVFFRWDAHFKAAKAMRKCCRRWKNTSTENVLTWAKIYVVVQELYETRAKQESNWRKNPCEFLVRSLTGSGWDTHY